MFRERIQMEFSGLEAIRLEVHAKPTLGPFDPFAGLRLAPGQVP